MSLKTVTVEIRDKIRDKKPEYNRNVFVLTQIEAFFLVENYGLPGVGLFYTGSPSEMVEKVGITIPQYETHKFDVFIFLDQPSEEDVVIGNEKDKGLMEYLLEMQTLLLTWLPSGCTHVKVTGKYATKSYIHLKSDNLAGTIGMGLEYIEQIS